MPTPNRKAADLLRRFALSMPGATEDHPWGETVAKIGGKVFVFLGTDPGTSGDLCFSVKLADSGKEALQLPFASPTGYGLGKHGWVTIKFPAGKTPPVDMFQCWIEES